MRNLKLLLSLSFLIFLLSQHDSLYAQMIMDLDSLNKINEQYQFNNKSDHLKISGYIQPQFQIAQNDGIDSYAGGDFPTDVNNRFMLRRGRLRFDYLHFSKNAMPDIQFVCQFDGTERGVFIRDFWGRVFENKFDLFAFTIGMFPRPFGYEINLSSAQRESPERGRMSQILMRTERDMGAMITLDSRKKNHPLKKIKIDAGFFNGPGLISATDIDSRKDFISRISLKPSPIFKNTNISSSLSYFNGGMIQNTRYIYTTQQNNYMVDSIASNEKKYAPRKYYGADLQLKRKIKAGFSEFRIEYIRGKQTASAETSETPGKKFSGTEGYYIRNFDGLYVYFVQNIFNKKHQLIFKYDWYDPNTNVRAKKIDPAFGFTIADIKYATIGAGYCYFMNDNLKTTFWYDRVMNEKTLIPGLLSDAKDDVFTFRMQFTF